MVRQSTTRAQFWLGQQIAKVFQGSFSVAANRRNFVVEFCGDDVRAAVDEREIDEFFANVPDLDGNLPAKVA